MIITILEVAIAIVVLAVCLKYINYVKAIITLGIPSTIMPYVLIAITISIILFIISRKE